MHFLERTQIYDPKVPKTISYPKLTSRLQERKIEFQNSPSNCTEHEIVKKKNENEYKEQRTNALSFSTLFASILLLLMERWSFLFLCTSQCACVSVFIFYSLLTFSQKHMLRNCVPVSIGFSCIWLDSCKHVLVLTHLKKLQSTFGLNRHIYFLLYS